MIIKLCAKCGQTIQYPKRYCDSCQDIVNKRNQERKKEYNKRYDQDRDPNTVAFYNSDEWKGLRDYKLQQVDYKCEECMEQFKAGKIPLRWVRFAEEVHHLEEVKDNWSRRLDYTNLLALCHIHHNHKHGRYIKKNKK